MTHSRPYRSLCDSLQFLNRIKYDLNFSRGPTLPPPPPVDSPIPISTPSSISAPPPPPPSSVPSLSPTEIRDIRSNVMALLNTLSDTDEKFQSVCLDLDDLRSHYGSSSDQPIRLALAKSSIDAASHGRSNANQTKQFIRLFPMLNDQWHWHGAAAAGGWDLAFVAVYKRFSPDFNPDALPGEDEAKNLIRRGYKAGDVGEQCRSHAASIAAKFEVYFGVMMSDDEGWKRFVIPMMERELSRNTTYELAMIALVFLDKCKEREIRMRDEKYQMMVQAMRGKFYKDAPEPFGRGCIHPIRQIMGRMVYKLNGLSG